MSTYSYKNDTDQDLVIVGVGEVKAGETLASDTVIENPNLTPLSPSKKKKVNEEPGDE